MQVLLLPEGGPLGVQLPATSQLPLVPPLQLMVHCASVESGQSNSAMTAAQRNRLPPFVRFTNFAAKFCVFMV
jgi:hypothetical protein